MQLLEDLNILSFVRISRLNWIGPLLKWTLKENYYKNLTIFLKETMKRATKTLSVTVYRQIFKKSKPQNWKYSYKNI